MSTKLKIAASLLLIAGLIAVAWPKSPAPQAADLTLTARTPRAAPVEKGTQLVPEPARSERANALPPRASQPAVVLQPREAGTPLSGLLLDAHARALPGLHVRFQAGHREISAREFRLPERAKDASLPTASSGADGRFQIEVPERDGELVADEEHWTTVLSSLCRSGNAKGEHIVVAVPHLAHAGRVVDPSGKPLGGARIEIHTPRSLRRSFPQILDASAEVAWVVESEPDGTFRFVDAPRLEDATLEASLTGFRRLVQAAPLASDPALELVLQPIDAQPGMLYGEVLDPHGQPVAGARIMLGHANLTLSDEQGQFHLELPKAGARDTWIALKPGFQPAIEQASAAVQAGQADPGELVVLRLGAPPLSIRGQVLDEAGNPQNGWRVFVSDPTFFGAMDEIPAQVEGLLAGAADRGELEKRMASAPQGSDPETILRDVSSTFWTFARTDSSGNFVLEGLLERNYRLSALDPGSLLRIDGDPIPAGTSDARIRVPEGRYVQNLGGRVLSAAGKPVPLVQLLPAVDVLTVQLDEHSRSTFDFLAAPVVTDAEGRFRFERLPREQVYLRLSGEDIVPSEWGRHAPGGIGKLAGEKPAEVVIRVELSFHVQVDFAPDSADKLRLLGANGQAVEIHVFEGTTRTSTDALELEGGRSKIMVVGENAATLVLYKQGEEVRRAPLLLLPGQLNRVQL